MTDREPDDLYDALRDRLADYGQEPPAPLWAGIRAQLPPSVAPPQLRSKRRVALLGLLLLVVSVGSWQIWRTIAPGWKVADNGPVAASSARLAMPKAQETPAITPATAGNKPLTAANTLKKDLAEQVAAASEATAALPPAASPSAAKQADLVKSRSIAGEANAGGTRATARHTSRNELVAAAARPATGTAAKSWHQRQKQAAALAVRMGGMQPAPFARATRQRTPGGFTPEPGQTQATAPAAAPIARANTEPNAANTAAPAAAAQLADNSPGHLSAEETARIAPATAGTAAAAAQGGHAVASQSSSFRDGAVEGFLPQFIGLKSNLVQLPSPLSLLALPDWQAPATAPQWSVQVLLGPSLTFRRLAMPLYESVLPSVASTVTSGYPSTALSGSTNVANVERPALAPSGQVQFRRSLNGRWAVAGGLGYRQYVSALSVQMYQLSGRIIPTPTSSYFTTDSALVGTIHRRDTYHYFTVPVQASYALGVGSRRWRTAVLAGAELGVYVGGSTSEGPPCNCAARTWSPTGSPYRALSLALSLGLDVRYRLGAPGSSTWELLAQPTATYGLTSLARTGSGYYARYPYTAGLLLGVSHDLR